MLIGKHEAAENNRHFGDHHQQRQPVKAKRPAGESGDHKGDGDQRHVDDRAAEARAAELLGQIGAKHIGQKTFTRRNEITMSTRPINRIAQNAARTR